jgi:hypothetical protein
MAKLKLFLRDEKNNFSQPSYFQMYYLYLIGLTFWNINIYESPPLFLPPQFAENRSNQGEVCRLAVEICAQPSGKFYYFEKMS